MGRVNVAGYIKLDRGILDWGWYKDPNTMRVFIHLLLTANYCDGEFMGVEIHRGQVATSYESITDDLGLTIQNVRTAIKHLKSTGEVTSKAYSKFQVISITNYNKYQGELTVNLTPGQQPLNINIRNKEKKNNIYTMEDEDLPPWMKKSFEELGYE